MGARTVLLVALAAAVTGNALALMKPEEGTTLPDYDVRATLKGVGLGSSPGLVRQRFGAGAPPSLSPGRQAALARLEAAAGPGLSPIVVRGNALTEGPKVLFRYDGVLTRPDSRDAALVARSFLTDNAELLGLDATAVASFDESRRFTTRDGTLTILHLVEHVGGLVVLNGDVRFAITPSGEVASVTTGNPLPSVAGLTIVPALPAGEAVRAAAEAIGVTLGSVPVRVNPASERVALFERGPLQAEPTLEPVYFPMGRVGRIAYKVVVQQALVPALYEVIVDGQDGTLLQRYNLTKYVQTNGLVFPENPGVLTNMPQNVQFYDDTVLVDPRWPLGWADANRSIGNVADVKEDWVGDDEATVGQRSYDFSPGPPYFFQDLWSNSWATSSNARTDTFFTITNLLYFANVYHDWLYPYGFDEPAGNWQRDNFGRGGRDNDFVYVDAQDAFNAGQRNNANMATAQDGGHPRAQFYLFQNAPPLILGRRDSDVDNDVVFHEFTHGLSHRLVGSADSGSCLSGFQAGAMGEGWSDFYACAYNDDPIMGEYATVNPVSGIRGAPYNNYPACHRYTPADFCSPNGCGGVSGAACEVHDEGELWAVTLWEVRAALIAADPANGAAIALTLVTDGMKLTGCNPTFLDARDGILLADRYAYAGAHQCILWAAFAGRYMGYSSTTLNGDDTQPAGTNDVPPFCLTQGTVVLDHDRYACADSLVATVHDANATGAPVVQLSSSSGDSLTVPTTGAGPSYATSPVSVTVGAPNTGDGILQVAVGDTITAAYSDTSPPALAQTTASVNCLARVEREIVATGGCSPDGAAWPVPINEILDAGEYVDFSVRIRNREPRSLTNARMTLVSVSNPMVVSVTQGPVTVGTLAPYSGSGSATFRLGASSFLSAGTVTLDFLLEADGFTGTEVPLLFTVPVASDYQVVSATTGVEDFEASNGGYLDFPWPGEGTPEEWNYGICGAASGTKAWHAGSASCTGNAVDQDAVLQSVVLNPITPTRVSWYPTGVRFNHRLSVGGADSGYVIVGEVGMFSAAGDYATLTPFGSADNTATFQPVSVPLTAADTLGASIQNENGLVVWFDFDTVHAPALSQEWAIDDVEVTYDAADAVAAPPPTCVEAGYTGTLNGCAAASSTRMYDTLRPAEVQYAGNGSFWTVGASFNLFDLEFPTPTAVGDTLVLLASSNPDDGAHQGVMAVNARPITDPAGQSFGVSTCAPVPTPVGPASVIAVGQPITVTWTAFVESGSTPALVGYNVYRLDAEAYPAPTSTIDDYVLRGVLVGNTVGQADINRFTDTAPAVVTPPDDHFTYAIQPLYRCASASCAPVPGTFAGSETTPGKANLSTDSLVSNGGPAVPGTVTVSSAMLATFDSWSAVRQTSGGVRVVFSTVLEIDTIAFDVFRGVVPDTGAMARVGTVPAVGGGRYELVDSGAPAGTVYYQVREIATSGQPSRTDVFAATSPTTVPGRGGSGRRVRTVAGTRQTGPSRGVNRAH